MPVPHKLCLADTDVQSVETSASTHDGRAASWGCAWMLVSARQALHAGPSTMPARAPAGRWSWEKLANFQFLDSQSMLQRTICAVGPISDVSVRGVAQVLHIIPSTKKFLSSAASDACLSAPVSIAEGFGKKRRASGWMLRPFQVCAKLYGPANCRAIASVNGSPQTIMLAER